MLERAAAPPDTIHVTDGGRRVPWVALAIVCDIAAAAAFFVAPWANGRGPFAFRDFTGADLARLVRNTDVLLPSVAGGPLAAVLSGAMWAAPVLLLVSALLLLGSPLTTSPTGAVRAAAVASAAAATIVAVTMVVIAAGAGEWRVLERLPGAGAWLALIGCCAGLFAARRAARGAGQGG